MQKIVQAPELTAQVASVLIACGSAAVEADTVASNLVMANLSGHDSHGVGMLPRYVDAVLEGGLKPNHSARVLLDSGSLLTLDGQRGYGQVVGEQAMALGIARAQTHGSCIMTLGQAHHLGRIGHFAEMAERKAWSRCILSTCCRVRWWRPLAAPTGVTAPTPAASASRSRGVPRASAAKGRPEQAQPPRGAAQYTQ